MSARTTAAPRALLAALVAVLMIAGVLGGLPSGTARADSAPRVPADPATPTTVTADPLPTVQIDGVVWSQAVVGTTVYAAGRFTSARPAGAPAGTSETPRGNLLAYDIRTGVLQTSFAPQLNGQALTVTASPDGSRVYVGGDFTEADGQPRSRIAAYSTATGQLLTDFRPAANGPVRAIAATNATVYLGGSFTAVGSTGRNRLAAVSAATGALLPWAPQPGVGPTTGNKDGSTATSNAVLALVVTSGGSQVVAAGRFDTLNGTKATGVGALDAATGATRPFAANRYITNQGVNAAIWSLSTDGTNVYGTGYNYFGPGSLEGLFAASADGGAVRWFVDCYGDSYSTYATGGVVYSASHAHDCRNIGSFPEQTPRYHMFGNAFSVAAAGTNTGGGVLAGQPAPAHQAWGPVFTPGTFTGQGQAGWTVTGNGDYVVYGGEFPAINGVKQQGLVRFAVPSIAPNKVGPKTDAAFASTATMVRGAVRLTWKAVADADNEHLTYRVHRDSEASAPVCEVTQPSLWWRLPTYGCADTGATAGSHRWLVTVTDPFGNRRASAWTTATVPAGSVGTPRPYQQAVTADGAIDTWSLGEPSGTTGWDYTGAMDLTVNSGVTRNVPGAIRGDRDTATQFNGGTTGFAATRTAIAGPQVFSLESWIRTTTTKGGKIIGFGNSNTGTSPQNDRNVYMDTTGRVFFGVWPGATRTVNSTAPYNDGRWHHVVATLSRAGMALYVDGVRVAARTDTVSAERSTGYWRIGGDTSWAGAPFFAGQIDEVAVYPSALSAQQVAAHHSLGSTGQEPNAVPTAAMTTSTSDLTVSVEGSGSGDRDGRIVSHTWDFGDGATGTGVTAAHTYSTAGTYRVQLTVTDDRGATGTTARDVTVSPPPTGPGSVAADTFGRAVSTGWGVADAGGPWTIGGGGTNASVSGGAGSLTAAPGRSTTALLGAVDRTDVALQAAVVLPEAPTGGGTFVSLATRRVGTSDYRVKLKYSPTGAVQASLVAVVDGVERSLGAYPVAGTSAAGRSLTVRFETSGTGPTTLRVKAWPTGTAEPADWALTRTDDTATLQRPGALFLQQYNSGTATAPSTLRVDDLRAEQPGAVTAPQPAPEPEPQPQPEPQLNQAPTAAFTAAGDGLAVTVDGSGSTDLDGDVVTWAWDFGDGTTGSGATAAHTYAAAGTHRVRLTVTDDRGATGTVERSVTVAAPDAVRPLAADAFDRTVASGLGAADAGGPWSVSGGTTSVSGGAGHLEVPGAGRSTAAWLGSVSAGDVAAQATVSLASTPTGGGTFVYLTARRTASGHYRTVAKLLADGRVSVGLSRVVAGTETTLRSVVLTGVTYRPGTDLHVRLDVSGAETATLNAKAWLAGTPEPEGWQVTATDSTEQLRGAGGVGVTAYVSGSATAVPVRVDVDGFWAGVAGSAPPAA